VSSFALWLLYRPRSCRYPLNRKLDGPTAGADVSESREICCHSHAYALFLGCPALSQVTITTEKYPPGIEPHSTNQKTIAFNGYRYRLKCRCSHSSSLSLIRRFVTCNGNLLPIQATARSKALVCGISPAEMVGSNPTGGMDVCLLCCVLSRRGLLRRTNHSSKGVVPSVVCLSVIVSLDKGEVSAHWNCQATKKIHLVQHRAR